MKVWDESLISSFSDWSQGFTLEHYLVDVASQTVIKKLDIPLSKAWQRVVQISETEYAFPANTVDGNFIYIYNNSDDSLTKGVKLSGSFAINNFLKVE